MTGREKIEWARGSWIADRCFVDLLAYIQLMFAQNREFVEVARQMIVPYLSYDLLIYLPPEIKLEDDGVRNTDPEFQKEVDKAILQVLYYNNLTPERLCGKLF